MELLYKYILCFWNTAVSAECKGMLKSNWQHLTMHNHTKLPCLYSARNASLLAVYLLILYNSDCISQFCFDVSLLEQNMTSNYHALWRIQCSHITQRMVSGTESHTLLIWGSRWTPTWLHWFSGWDHHQEFGHQAKPALHCSHRLYQYMCKASRAKEVNLSVPQPKAVRFILGWRHEI